MTLQTQLINSGNHSTDRVGFKITKSCPQGINETMHSLGRGESINLDLSAGEGIDLFCTDVVHGSGNVRPMTAGLLLTEGPGGKMVDADFGDPNSSRSRRVKALLAAVINEMSVIEGSGLPGAPDARIAITLAKRAADAANAASDY